MDTFSDQSEHCGGLIRVAELIGVLVPLLRLTAERCSGGWVSDGLDLGLVGFSAGDLVTIFHFSLIL